MNYFRQLNAILTKPIFCVSLHKECCCDSSELVCNSIQRAKKSVKACVYKFDSAFIFKALKEALGRNVSVTMIMDYKQNKNNGFVSQLIELGADIKLWKINETLRAKFLIIDSAHVLTGSYDLTMPTDNFPTKHNVDLIISLYDDDAIEKFTHIFNDMTKILACPTCVTYNNHSNGE